MKTAEIQKILRNANSLPYAFQVEDGQIFASWYDIEAVEKKFGKPTARKIATAATAIETDKGIVWTA